MNRVEEHLMRHLGVSVLALAALGFAAAMGFFGGFLPAARAARLRIVDALRAA